MVTTVVAFMILGVVVFMFLVIGVPLLTLFMSMPGTDAGLPSAIVAVVPIVFVAAIVTFVALALVRGSSGRSARWYRLDQFARANGMTYLPSLDDPQLPGMIFGIGGSRRATDLVRGEQPRFVEFADYRYTTGSGKEQTTHHWGYVAVKLDVPLPNIVLDATSNNGLFGASNLPTTFSKGQRLSLEGDFDKHFALYCPTGYERDALYLFTPDIMARFIDTAATLDVEIVDDWLFLYGRRELSTLDPATWAWLFSVVAALLDKLAQWGRWRDERLRTDAAAVTALGSTTAGTDTANAGTAQANAASAGAPAGGGASALPFAAPLANLTPPPGVAAPGRRLKRSVPWVALVVFALFAVLWLLGPIGLFAGMTGR